MNTTQAKRWITPALVFLALLVGSFYVYFWRFGFSSDYAMIGLLAKRILTTGEQFIFVPKVGYQGLLYEANLVALMFKAFGISPITLNLAPFLTYLGFCFVFYGAVRAWHGLAVARLATLLIILSTPLFYGAVLRTQPNYGETFLMGTALFWLYRKILEGRPSVVVLSTLFGIIAGFGLYTYGQIVYFLGAIGLHLFYIACHDSQFKWSRPVRLILMISGLNLFCGIISFFCSLDKIQIGHRIIKFIPVAMIQFSFALSMLTIFLDCFVRHWKFFKTRILSIIALILGGIFGFSPSLYYHRVLHGFSLNRMGISGDFSDIMRRADILWRGQGNFFNFSEGSILGSLSLVLGISFLAVFIFDSFRLLFSSRLIFSGVQRKKVAFDISPFFYLIWVAVITFLIADAVVDITSIRYVLVLLLSYCVAYAVVIIHTLTSVQRRWKKVAVACGLGLILVTNTLSLGGSLRDEPAPGTIDLVIDYLRQKGLRYGFGDYWYSYIITFITNESIIMEPVISNYIPYYLQEVAPQPRVAYIDVKPYKILLQEGTLGQKVKIYGSQYEVKDRATIEKVDIFTLEKVL